MVTPLNDSYWIHYSTIKYSTDACDHIIKNAFISVKHYLFF